MSPKLSVLMSVYNGERFVVPAIESVLKQSFPDFEFLIIDDGSTDTTPTLLRSFSDPRIRVHTNESNQGLVRSLNIGIGLARSPLIARMDADDFIHPNRFEVQYSFLERHPDVGVLGCGMQQVDSRGRHLSSLRFPESHREIFWTFFFGLCIVHASVFMRRSLLQELGGYNEEYRHVEDTELWSRALLKTQFANLPDELYVRRLHGRSIISTQSRLQIEREIEIKGRLFEQLIGRKLSPKTTAHLVTSQRSLTADEQKEAISAVRSLASLLNVPSSLVESRIQEIRRSAEFPVIKTVFASLKKCFPVPLRHRLASSSVGRLLKKRFLRG